MLFSELSLDSRLHQGISDAGFIKCTNVQAQTLPLSLGGRDVAVQSQTGTGKTAAFLITILQAFAEGRLRRALIVVPTRELATQVDGDARQLAVHLPITVGAIYGGVGYDKQEQLLRNGAELLVGTPGRILDFHGQRKLKLSEIDVAVVDEADRLFDMGFYYDILRILRAMPRPGQRQTMLFSATLDSQVRRLASEFMDSPAEVAIEPERKTVTEVEQVLYHVGSREKMSVLLGLLKRRQPRSVLIFTNKKIAAEEIAKRLTHNGLTTYPLTGDLPQYKRERTLDALKNGRIMRLVATDVAARGLHIEDLDMVVNYDLPEDPENYVHRIGRTARAGRKGVAVTLACEEYVQSLEPIERFMKMRIPVGEVDDALLDNDRTAGQSMRRLHLPSLPIHDAPTGAASVGSRKHPHGSSATPASHAHAHSRARTHAATPHVTHAPSPAQPPEPHHTRAGETRRHGFFKRVLRALRVAR